MKAATGDLHRDLGWFTSFSTLLGHKSAIHKLSNNMQCSACKPSFHALTQYMHRSSQYIVIPWVINKPAHLLFWYIHVM